MPDWRYQTGFRAGEVANSFLGSFDSDVYGQSARTLENAVVTRRGSAQKRAGTLYVAGTTSDGNARVVFWQPRTTNRNMDIMVVVEGDTGGLITFYNTANNSSLGTAVSPYTDADLSGLFFIPLTDKLIILHEDYKERQLLPQALTIALWPDSATSMARDHSRPRLMNKATSITMTEVSSTKITFSSPIVDDQTAKTDSLVFTLDKAFYETTEIKARDDFTVGRLVAPTSAGPHSNWQGPWIDKVELTTETFSYAATTRIGETVTVTRTAGTFSFTGKLGHVLQLDNDTHSFVIAKVTSSTVAECVRLAGTAAATGTSQTANTWSPEFLTLDKATHPWLLCEDMYGTSVNMYASLEFTFSTDQVGATIYYNGIEMVIDSITDTQNAVVTRKNPAAEATSAAPSSNWSISPNKYNGFPKVGTVHQNRLFYGGFKRDPALIVGSGINDHWDFTPGSADDDPLSLRISDDSSSGVTWMHSTDDDLLVGTAQKEFRLAGNPLTPTNLGFNTQSWNGGAPVTPVQLGIGVIYVDRCKCMLKETSFVFERQRYESVDINAIASHLFDATNTIKEQHLVRAPEQGVFVVRSDGMGAMLTRNKQHEVNAWSTWPSADTYIESAAVAEGATTDNVWMIVKRTVNSVVKRFIEVWEPGKPSCDSRVVYASPASTTLTGLSHLEGETVRVNIDGGDMGTYTVASGQITGVTLGATGTDVHVGLGYSMSVVPHPMITQDKQGLTAARGERVGGVHVLVSSSLGGTINTRPVIVPSVGDIVIDTVWDKHSGWVTHFGNLPDATHRFPSFTIVQVESSSFEILAIGAFYEDTAEV